MINHDLIKVNSICHALLSSPSNPNILIPIKGVIREVKYDESNPLYRVQILKFYDHLFFVKKNFVNKSFRHNFKKKPKTFWINTDNVKTIHDLENLMIEEKNWVVIDSLLVFKYKNEMQDMFNKIQEFLILKNIKEWRNNSTRSFYKGKLHIKSKYEFDVRMAKMIQDMFPGGKKEYEEFCSKLN